MEGMIMGIKIDDKSYTERIKEGVENSFMQEAVASAQGRFRSGRQNRADELGDWEDWRTLGEEIRTHTLQNIDYYLHELSESVSKRSEEHTSELQSRGHLVCRILRENKEGP